MALTSKDTFADFKNRNIERAAAEIVDGDLFVLFLVEPYASDAAVGSLMMRRTSSPAICPASLVA